MANIFRNTGDEYFQLPKRLITDGICWNWKQATFKLYAWLLYEAQEHSTPVLLRKSSAIIEAMRIESHQLTEARKQLQGVVNSFEVSSGLWSYDIVTQPDMKGFNLDTLTRDDLEPFFIARLGEDHLLNENGATFKCPFCNLGKRREYPLSVKLTDSQRQGIGVWHCFAWEEAGRLVYLEQRLQQRLGNQITTQEAHKRVVSFFTRQINQRREEATISHNRTLL